MDRDGLGIETGRRWLKLEPEAREATGVTAPTRALRDEINATIRDGLVAEGAIRGPAMEVEKLVPLGLTAAEMTRTANYRAGDTALFNRRYKTLGVEKGDRREVESVDAKSGTVRLKDAKGNIVDWKPVRIAAAKGGLEVYRSETTALRAGDRVRFTRNDPASRLTNGQLATVDTIERDGVRFRLEDGSLARLDGNDPQLRHLDRAWASTVHAFQGRTVDRIVAAMPAGNPNLVNQKSFYVAIGRARERADLITDDPKRLADHLQRATGERVAALDAVAEHAAREAAKQAEALREREPEHLVRAFEALDRAPETARDGQRSFDFERDAGPDTGRRREEKSADRAGKRGKALPDADRRDRDRGGEGRDLGRAGKQSERERTPEPPQKSRDMDLGL